MKKKQYFYKSCGRRIDILSINTWLCGCKDYSYKWDMLNKESVYGIRTLPKRRHRRSIAVQNLRRLYGFTVSDLLMPIEFPERFKHPHSIGYKQFRGRRLYIY